MSPDPFSIFQGMGFEMIKLCPGERGGLVVQSLTPEREVGGSKHTPPCCVLEQDTFTPRKVLVIHVPRKRCLCPDMTEKMLTLSTQKSNTKNFV